MNLSGRSHVRESTWGKSKSVVWAEESSHKSFSFRLVDFSSSVVIVFFPEVIEVSSNIVINFIVIHNVESSNDIGGPFRTSSLWELPDTGSSTEWVLLFDSISLEDVIHNVVLISSIA